MKASVEYIKKLKIDQDRKKYLEEKSRLQEYQNKKLLLKLQVSSVLNLIVCEIEFNSIFKYFYIPLKNDIQLLAV